MSPAMPTEDREDIRNTRRGTSQAIRVGFATGCMGIGAAFVYHMIQNKDGGQIELMHILAASALVFVGLVLIDDGDRMANFILSLVREITVLIRPSAAKDEPEPETGPKPKAEVAKLVEEQGADIKGYGTPPPRPDEWNRSIRPVLAQASLYSTPTYYLDRDLKIVDWNLAFEVVFSDITTELRMQHVNYFIAQLKNSAEVFERGREFSRLDPTPLFHNETLEYEHKRFGVIRFSKFASRLVDHDGAELGWSVALLIRRMEPGGRKWAELEAELVSQMNQALIWNAYSASYDPVLQHYPAYARLQEAVLGGIPRTAATVADLGAGTGNTTKLLLERGHQVVAVENNLCMLDRLRAQNFANQVEIVKSSLIHLDMLKHRNCAAATLVNVLYAIDEPLVCLKGVNAILPIGGSLALSTPYQEVNSLMPLLDDIKDTLVAQGRSDLLQTFYPRLRDANKMLEDIALRYTAQQYRDWLTQAGFAITNEITRTYPDAARGAVMVLHAQKVKDAAA